ncbi:hypothetical protein ACHAQD_007615 [Fusarium lateritium]
MRTSSFFSLLLCLAAVVVAITVTDGDDGSITIDAESAKGFTATINNLGDLTSLVYQGNEYQNQEAFSHLASGIDADSVTYKSVAVTQDPYIIVTSTASNQYVDVIQYYVFVDGQDKIYVATYTNKEPTVGELRFIFRLDNLPYAYPHGDVSNTRNGSVIESQDIYIVGNETRSKWYSNERFIDDQVHCAYRKSPDVHACFILPVRAYDASTGGPFARDIDLNYGPEYHGLTYYMNHGNEFYDPYRQGFHGPYVFSFTQGTIPTAADVDADLFDGLGLEGYVSDAERGFVKGIASGTSSDYSQVLHWYNNQHQQWVYAEDDGSFKSPPLVPGEYTQALYQHELLAANFSVVVKAGQTLTSNIVASNPIITQTERTTVLQIGKYDGTPDGFLNGDKINHMHLSDDRMSAWNTSTFVVGKSDDAEFPAIILRDVNDQRVIKFDIGHDLDKATLRIATTMALSGGRPAITVNGFEGDIPDGPADTPSRGPTKVGIFYSDVATLNRSG